MGLSCDSCGNNVGKEWSVYCDECENDYIQTRCDLEEENEQLHKRIEELENEEEKLNDIIGQLQTEVNILSDHA